MSHTTDTPVKAPALTPYQKRTQQILSEFGCDAIGDLNRPKAPGHYTHYVDMPRFDEAILDSRTDFTARCGYAWGRVPRVDDLDQAVGSSSREEFCPLCWVIEHPTLFGRWKNGQ